MISSTGRYWTAGVIVSYDSHRKAWAAGIDFLDDGFADDDPDTGRISTEGKLHTRYMVKDGQQAAALTAAIDVIVADAERLGIEFNDRNLYYDDRDGIFPEPDDWKRLQDEQVARLGWAS
ncbi:hypothetical protein GCM10010399_64100 [Dactylosporangium fulvum]|uniref:Uncharacterized protein n=1 Tax=Dactylosporangium fulvum TaxID=53359 RepID=A0ABY5W885_9ACTN|nr:hypothetical protein [Dactylosporangium fulvum]UWP85767.1 hypothetical protein Dfulv_16605 [Dactylosporangium fulvum]